MEKRTLGRGGPSVSAVGLDCMGMSEFYAPEQMIRASRCVRQPDLGVNVAVNNPPGAAVNAPAGNGVAARPPAARR